MPTHAHIPMAMETITVYEELEKYHIVYNQKTGQNNIDHRRPLVDILRTTFPRLV